MRAKVINYDANMQCHVCRTEDGRTVRMDLFVSGCLPEDLSYAEIIGKEVEWNRDHAFISIAEEVRIV